MTINKNEINDDENISIFHFNKCIDFGNNYLAIADNEFINIWNENNNGHFSKLIKLNIGNKTPDLLLANDNYFISIQPNNKTIIIFNIKHLRQEKIIPNVDSIDSKNCFTFNRNKRNNSIYRKFCWNKWK